MEDRLFRQREFTGNTKSVATEIVELLITEQVSRTAEPITRALSVNLPLEVLYIYQQIMLYIDKRLVLSS